MASPMGAGLMLAPPFYKMQPDAVLNQATPTPGNPYTILDTVHNVRIYTIAARVTWTVQPTPLEVHGIIDGIAWKWDVANPVSGTWYYCSLTPTVARNNDVLTATNLFAIYKAFLLEVKSCKLTAEVTGGTSDPLEARVVYAKYL